MHGQPPQPATRKTTGVGRPGPGSDEPLWRAAASAAAHAAARTVPPVRPVRSVRRARTAHSRRAALAAAFGIGIGSLLGVGIGNAHAAADAAPAAAAAAAAPTPCSVRGLEHMALCGTVRRALDPARPAGTPIDIHYVVVPALARQKKADPVFFLAGGPGQSAIALAGPIERMLTRLTNRRDLVLVDQRGTGRSAPLRCEGAAFDGLERGALDVDAQTRALDRCRAELQKLPHGDLRHYTTPLAAGDLDAVRRALGAERINLVGGSYGTRVALEVLRQFPQTVRRVVLDGVAPPDMALPASFERDGPAAWQALVAACAADAACRSDYPRLADDVQALRARLPLDATVPDAATGRAESVRITLERFDGLLRGPLYAPPLAAALPYAVTEAAAGRWTPLVGLSAALTAAPASKLALGQHFSVVCAEDQPLAAAARAADASGAASAPAGSTARLYERLCADWPRAPLPDAFRRVGTSAAPVLLWSGGLDPATPPRHGARMAAALGAHARHVVVPQAGHGVLGLACVRERVFRFIDAERDADALALDFGCASAVPRPPFVRPPARAASTAADAAPRSGT